MITSVFKRILKGEKPSEEQVGLQALENLKRLYFGGEQSIKEFLRAWNVGESKNLDGTIATLIYRDEFKAVFMEAMQPGGTFPEHWHEIDEIEELEVLKGEVVDYVLKSEILKRGQIITYQGGQKHGLKNNDQKNITIILVTILFQSTSKNEN